jgi:hypothetical protein
MHVIIKILIQKDINFSRLIYNDKYKAKHWGKPGFGGSGNTSAKFETVL